MVTRPAEHQSGRLWSVSKDAHNSLTRYILIKFCLHIHFNILATGMRNGDEASPSISPAGRGQLVKYSSESLGIF